MHRKSFFSRLGSHLRDRKAEVPGKSKSKHGIDSRPASSTLQPTTIGETCSADISYIPTPPTNVNLNSPQDAAGPVSSVHQPAPSHSPVLLPLATSQAPTSTAQPTSSTTSSPPNVSERLQPLEGEPPKEDQGPGKSLWEQAAEKLDHKVREALEEIREGPEKIQKEAQKADDPNIPSLPQMVSDEAQRRMEDMEHRQWALPIKVKGKEIEIRDFLNKCLKFAKAVKEKGDAFISFDPTGYAKIAWIPFSLIVDVGRKLNQR